MNWWQKHLERMTARGWHTTHLGHLWSGDRHLRPARSWSWHHRAITCGRDLRASLRAGFLSWPGCYRVVFFTLDGDLVCPHCVIKDFKRHVQDIRDRSFDRIVGMALEEEIEDDGCCRECEKKINED